MGDFCIHYLLGTKKLVNDSAVERSNSQSVVPRGQVDISDYPVPSVETGRHVSAYTLDSDGLHVIDHYKAIRFQEETNILDRQAALPC